MIPYVSPMTYFPRRDTVAEQEQAALASVSAAAGKLIDRMAALYHPRVPGHFMPDAVGDAVSHMEEAQGALGKVIE